MSNQVSFTCLNPEAGRIRPASVSGLTVPRVTSLADKKIAVIWCGKAGGQFFLDVVSALLKKRYPSAIISRFVWDVSGALEKIVHDTDTFIYGVGDSGIGAWESTARTIKLEKLNKPGVVIFCDHLVPNAVASAEAQGMPGVRMVTLPSSDYYPNRASVENIEPVARAAIDKIIDQLTRPLDRKEKIPAVQSLNRTPRRVKIAADNLESAFEKFNDLFIKNRWGDGLPLVPPTRESVQAMLSGTTRSPDEIIGAFPTPDGLALMSQATLEKIAINSVMAGAKPEYFPVIVAALEGLTDKQFSPHVFTSEGSFTLLIAVSGPLAKKIDMNSGIGLLGHGWRANNTIGRAIRLSLMNIGHLRPNEYDLALIGRPSSHTFYVLAEDEDCNPWEPYQVVHGFQPGESCVTVSAVGGPGPFGIKIYGGGTVAPWTPQGILNEIAQDVASDRGVITQYKPGEGIPAQPRNRIVILHPEVVIGLCKMGFTRQSLRDYLIDRTAVPYEELTNNEIQALKKRLRDRSEAFFGSSNFPSERVPLFTRALRPGGKIPVVISPDDITILVAGGPSGYSFGMSYLRGAHIVKLIR